MKRHLKRLQIVLNDRHKKPLSQICGEVLWLWWLKKQFPYHYFGRFFYRKDAPKNIQDFLTVQQYNKINASLFHQNRKHPSVFAITDNKLMLHYFGQAHNLPLPELYSFNFRNAFYFNGSSSFITNVTELKAFFKSVLKSKNQPKVFIKPAQGSGGKAAFLLTEKEFSQTIENYFDDLISGSYVHQEVIQQHEAINAIYSNSINTIRIETYTDRLNDTHIIGTYMRFGREGNVVDNACSGGFMVNIDQKTGRLVKTAFTSLIYGANLITEHPNTKVKFEGFKVPYFFEAIDWAKKLGRLLPFYVHGWDFAITPNGLVIVEGNNSPGLLAAEIGYGGYKNKAFFKEILEDAKVYHKTKR